MQLHLAARIPASPGIEGGQRVLDAAAALLHQRQVHP
jgi:hypothetical protein